MLSKGSLVEVFEDPITRQKKEGNARIVYPISISPDGLNIYGVNFIGDDPALVVTRMVDERPLVAEVVAQ